MITHNKHKIFQSSKNTLQSIGLYAENLTSKQFLTAKESKLEQSPNLRKFIRKDRILKISQNLGKKDLPFFNRSFDKKRLKFLFSWYYANKGESAAFFLIETLQKLGFTYAMRAGISLGVDDLKVPFSKSFALTQANESLNTTKVSVKNGDVTALEEFQQFVDTWHRTSENLKTKVVQNFTRNLNNNSSGPSEDYGPKFMTSPEQAKVLSEGHSTQKTFTGLAQLKSLNSQTKVIERSQGFNQALNQDVIGSEPQSRYHLGQRSNLAKTIDKFSNVKDSTKPTDYQSLKAENIESFITSSTPSYEPQPLAYDYRVKPENAFGTYNNPSKTKGWSKGWANFSQLKTLKNFDPQIKSGLKDQPKSNSLYNKSLLSYGNTLNPVYMMAFSGARGNLSQVRQLVGMRGLMADPQGQLVEYPIQSNFREGLTVTEYMISCYGARKGLVDTALRTAAAGYLTRRLVDVSHHQIVRFVTCGTKNGICLPLQKKKKESNRDFNLPSAWKVPVDISNKNNNFYIKENKVLSLRKENQIKTKITKENSENFKAPLTSCIGRVLAREIPGIAFRNQEIDISLGSSSILREIYETIGIYVRSPLTCRSEAGICQLCYGWSVSRNRLVGLGEAVGIIAAQSIGEPGTQLTMRTFHTGGVFSGDIMEECRAKHAGVVHFKGAPLGLMVRTAGGAIAFCIKNAGIFHIQSPKEFTTYSLLPNSLLFVRQGEKVLTGSLLAQIPNLPEIEETAGEATKTIVSNLSGEVRQTLTVNSELARIRVLAGQKETPIYFSNLNLLEDTITPDGNIKQRYLGVLRDTFGNPMLASAIAIAKHGQVMQSVYSVGGLRPNAKSKAFGQSKPSDSTTSTASTSSSEAVEAVEASALLGFGQANGSCATLSTDTNLAPKPGPQLAKLGLRSNPSPRFNYGALLQIQSYLGTFLSLNSTVSWSQGYSQPMLTPAQVLTGQALRPKSFGAKQKKKDKSFFNGSFHSKGFSKLVAKGLSTNQFSEVRETKSKGRAWLPNDIAFFPTKSLVNVVPGAHRIGNGIKTSKNKPSFSMVPLVSLKALATKTLSRLEPNVLDFQQSTNPEANNCKAFALGDLEQSKSLASADGLGFAERSVKPSIASLSVANCATLSTAKAWPRPKLGLRPNATLPLCFPRPSVTHDKKGSHINAVEIETKMPTKAFSKALRDQYCPEDPISMAAGSVEYQFAQRQRPCLAERSVRQQGYYQIKSQQLTKIYALLKIFVKLRFFANALATNMALNRNTFYIPSLSEKAIIEGFGSDFARLNSRKALVQRFGLKAQPRARALGQSPIASPLANVQPSILPRTSSFCTSFAKVLPNPRHYNAIYKPKYNENWKIGIGFNRFTGLPKVFFSEAQQNHLDSGSCYPGKAIQKPKKINKNSVNLYTKYNDFLGVFQKKTETSAKRSTARSKKSSCIQTFDSSDLKYSNIYYRNILNQNLVKRKDLNANSYPKRKCYASALSLQSTGSASDAGILAFDSQMPISLLNCGLWWPKKPISNIVGATSSVTEQVGLPVFQKTYNFVPKILNLRNKSQVWKYLTPKKHHNLNLCQGYSFSEKNILKKFKKLNLENYAYLFWNLSALVFLKSYFLNCWHISFLLQIKGLTKTHQTKAIQTQISENLQQKNFFKQIVLINQQFCYASLELGFGAKLVAKRKKPSKALAPSALSASNASNASLEALEAGFALGQKPLAKLGLPSTTRFGLKGKPSARALGQSPIASPLAKTRAERSVRQKFFFSNWGRGKDQSSNLSEDAKLTLQNKYSQQNHGLVELSAAYAIGRRPPTLSAKLSLWPKQNPQQNFIQFVQNFDTKNWVASRSFEKAQRLAQQRKSLASAGGLGFAERSVKPSIASLGVASCATLSTPKAWPRPKLGLRPNATVPLSSVARARLNADKISSAINIFYNVSSKIFGATKNFSDELKTPNAISHNFFKDTTSRYGSFNSYSVKKIQNTNNQKSGEFFPIQGNTSINLFKKKYPSYFVGTKEVCFKNKNILTHFDRVSYKLVLTKAIGIADVSESQKTPDLFGPQIGCFINIGDELLKDHSSAYCGQIIEKSSSLITLRLTENILYSNLRFRPARVSLAVQDGNWLGKGTSLVTLPYISSVTGDIVAGIPKIEQLFEARGEALEETIEKIWFAYRSAFVPFAKAVRECFKEIGLFVVEAIQNVYSSQGVKIADKHLEVIVRQMTRRALIIDPGDTEFLPDEFVDLHTIECVNWTTYGVGASYRPRLIGITKASLTSNSFLSSASFQQTARVLERETFLEKTDRLLGLKERVMMGALIDAGTGGFQTEVFLSKSNKSLSKNFFKKFEFFSRRKIEQTRENNLNIGTEFLS